MKNSLNCMPNQQYKLGQQWEQSYCEDLPRQVFSKKTDLAGLNNEAGAFEEFVQDNNRLDQYEKDGLAWIKKRKSTNTPRNVEGKKFERCEIRLVVEGITFMKCDFVGCRFIANRWNFVKLRDCTFTRCHFFNFHMHGCEFLDCDFELITMSPEFLELHSLAIDPVRLVKALQPNLRFLPTGKDPVVETRKFARTRAKVAGAIQRAVTETGDPDASIDSHRLATEEALKARICQHGLRVDVVNQKQVEVAQSFAKQLFASFPDRLELLLLQLSGWLTDWGKSLGKSMLFILSVIVLFAFLYYFDSMGWPLRWDFGKAVDSLLKSTDISVVAGYTSHRDVGGGTFKECIKVANLLLGLFWYSLVVSVVAKRILR